MEYLSRHNIPFTEKNIRTDAQALQELIGLGYSATPVTRIDGQVVLGFDPARLESALRDAGLLS